MRRATLYENFIGEALDEGFFSKKPIVTKIPGGAVAKPVGPITRLFHRMAGIQLIERPTNEKIKVMKAQIAKKLAPIYNREWKRKNESPIKASEMMAHYLYFSGAVYHYRRGVLEFDFQLTTQSAKVGISYLMFDDESVEVSYQVYESAVDLELELQRAKLREREARIEATKAEGEWRTAQTERMRNPRPREASTPEPGPRTTSVPTGGNRKKYTVTELRLMLKAGQSVTIGKENLPDFVLNSDLDKLGEAGGRKLTVIAKGFNTWELERFLKHGARIVVDKNFSVWDIKRLARSGGGNVIVKTAGFDEWDLKRLEDTGVTFDLR